MMMTLNYLKRIFNNNKYFTLYIMILSLPNVTFFIVNPGDKSWVAATINLVFIQCLMLLPILFVSTKWFMVITSIFILIIPAEIIHIINYDGYTTLPALSSALDSNASETKEFILNYRHIFVILIFIVPISFIAFRRNKSKNILRKHKCLLISLVLSVCALFSARTYMELGNELWVFNQKKLYSRLLSTGYPNGYVVNLFRYATEKVKLAESERKKKDFKFFVTVASEFHNKNQIAVLVIGETSRAYNWSLGGYKRETNPRLKNVDDLIYYKNAFTAATHTRESIQIALTRATPKDLSPIYYERSIINAYKAAGYRTVWISNQNKLSNVDTPITVISREADRQFYTNKDYEINPSYDEDLLPIINDEIRKNEGKLLLLIHTLGSHEIYRKRYPSHFEYFKPTTTNDDYNFGSEGIRDKLVNSYDNSIMYTDFILSEVIRFLDEQNKQAFMLYFSDHGENILDDNLGMFGHGGVNPTSYVMKIPIVLWQSNEYKTAHPLINQKAKEHANQRVTLTGLFDTLLNLSGINIDNHEANRSFIEKNEKGITLLTTSGKVIAL